MVQMSSHPQEVLHAPVKVVRCPTYSEGDLVAPVLQFVITGVEGEGLHDVGPGSQELPVQLSHLKATRSHHKANIPSFTLSLLVRMGG